SNCPIEFSPAFSLRAEIGTADLNGKTVAVRAMPNAEDQHAQVQVSAPSGTSSLRIRIRNDFGIAYDSELPKLGAPGNGFRLPSESWSATRDTLSLDVAGGSGAGYGMSGVNPAQNATVEGGATGAT